MSLLGFVAVSNKEEEEEEVEDGLEAGRKKGFALKQVRDHLSGKQGAGDKHAQGTSIFILFISFTQYICFCLGHRAP